MSNYTTASHTVFENHYHIVWITKYRYPVLHGDVRLRAREIIRRACAQIGVEIISGIISRDHVHLFVSVPPRLSISDMMRTVKGRSSYLLQKEFPMLKKHYWGCRFWARGYFCTTSGRVTRETILQYIEKHLPKPTGESR